MKIQDKYELISLSGHVEKFLRLSELVVDVTLDHLHKIMLASPIIKIKYTFKLIVLVWYNVYTAS